jgi:UPF0755 protein
MKRLIIPLILLVSLIASSIFAYLWWNSNTKPISASEEKIRFVIPRGRTAGQVAESLYEKKLIKNPLAFKFYVQLTGVASKIQAGEFNLSSNMNMYEILDNLFKGPLEIWVTIPEGLRQEEVIEIFIQTLEMSTAQAIIFRQDFLKESYNMEGYLFPDTYLFPRDAQALQIVARMKSVFDSKISTEMEGNYNLSQIVTLASLLERETITNAERPIVAGVIYKRLEADWPLQIDASVQHAVATANCELRIANCENWWPILTLEDLEETNSPYNTYKFTGLPPTPIASPGISSIKAAISPEESPYWYYIHADGQIHYAKTLAEHNRNIRVYLGK